MQIRSRGYEVFAVNPHADEVEGDRCYHSLSDIPGGVEAVAIGTRPDRADEAVRTCAEIGTIQAAAGQKPQGSTGAQTIWGSKHRRNYYPG